MSTCEQVVKAAVKLLFHF